MLHLTRVDQNVVNSQIDLMKRNEAEFRNNPDPAYSFDEGEGMVVRRTLTRLIHDSSNYSTYVVIKPIVTLRFCLKKEVNYYTQTYLLY